ncbi:MAG: hypothetical protein JWR85_2241 [Marmoricola sp.]|nr:hypothetical protein [Marmoricola sp.]
MTDQPGRPDLEPVRLRENDDGVVIEVTVSAPIDTVWEHLRDPELIGRWHGWDVDGLDAEIDYIYREHAREAATPYVLEIEGGPAPGTFEMGDRFDLREQDGATVVRITRGPRGTDDDWGGMYDEITQGWTSFLAQLRFTLEQQPAAARRTVFLSSGPAPAVRELLGVAGLRTGDGYRVDPTPELALAGTAWFATGAQTGLTVEGYGPGLVVLADKPATEPGRAETSMAIVSTYGLSDDGFARVEQAWQAWWATR